MPPPFVLLEEPLEGGGTGDVVALPDDRREHLERVLRLSHGSRLQVTDGRGRVASGVLRPAGVELAAAPRFEPRPAPDIVAMHALPKGRKLDEVVRLLTELGVARILPVAAERSVVRLEGDKAAKAATRWQAVADAALEQSRREWRCEVAEPVALESALAGLGETTRIVAHVGATAGLGEVLAPGPQPRDGVVVAVGPEGGWGPDDLSAFRSAGFASVSLGPTVLRTEHAAGVITSVVAYILGRLH